MRDAGKHATCETRTALVVHALRRSLSSLRKAMASTACCSGEMAAGGGEPEPQNKESGAIDALERPADNAVRAAESCAAKDMLEARVAETSRAH